MATQLKQVVATPTGQDQLTMDFKPGLVDRHPSLRDCVAGCVYARGLSRTAMELDKAPGNLSVELSEDTSRHFSIDSLERYIGRTGDHTPLMWLIEKFLAPSARPKNYDQINSLKAMASDLQRQLEALNAS
jgi:hypothetical protein